MPKPERQVLTMSRIPPSRVLEKAKTPLAGGEVLVIGVSKAGVFYAAGSTSDPAVIADMVSQFKREVVE